MKFPFGMKVFRIQVSVCLSDIIIRNIFIFVWCYLLRYKRPSMLFGTEIFLFLFGVISLDISDLQCCLVQKYFYFCLVLSP